MEKLMDGSVWLQKQVKHCIKPTKGQGLVEYALIIGLISLVLVAALGVLGVSIQGFFGRISAFIDAIPV